MQADWYIRKVWTTSEVERLRLLAGDFCLPQIAEMMGRSENSIRGAAQRFSVKVRTNSIDKNKIALHETIRELYKTKSISQICKKTGMSYSRVYRIVTKNPG